MLESRVTGSNFGHSASNSSRGPAVRRKEERLQIPAEYAGFRLADGRALIEVLGSRFFKLDKGRNVDERGAKTDVNSFKMVQDDLGMPEASTQNQTAIVPESVPDEEQAALGVERFRATGILPPPFEMTPPLPRIQARRDPAGDWWHGASRDGGSRLHDGIDLLAEPGTPVRSPISGTVRQINFTRSGMATITLTGESGEEVKFLYVAPVDGKGNKLLKPGAKVNAGQIIGSVEDLSEGYRDAGTGRMKNHVHMRMSLNGQSIDPLPWLAQWWANPEGAGKIWYPRRHSAAPGTGNAPDYDAIGEGLRWRSEGTRQ